tara:strand:- start:332 stop:565 length:234 start_codon:yes stop_codon:yes gene_type:complete
MEKFVEDKINHYAKSIIEDSHKKDAHSFGELSFYMALRRVVKGEATREDLGMMDAVNDTLQEMGVISEGDTFTKKLK